LLRGLATATAAAPAATTAPACLARLAVLGALCAGVARRLRPIRGITLTAVGLGLIGCGVTARNGDLLVFCHPVLTPTAGSFTAARPSA